jgi:hypothetical protein
MEQVCPIKQNLASLHFVAHCIPIEGGNRTSRVWDYKNNRTLDLAVACRLSPDGARLFEVVFEPGNQ